MIRVVAFVLTAALAMSQVEAGAPAWPVFLGLAGVLLACNLAFRLWRDAAAVALIGVGIVAMLAPIAHPWWFLYAAVWWTVTALIVATFIGRPGAGAALVVMPLGYAPMVAMGPVEALWLIIEVSGVVGLLLCGRGLDEAIGVVGRALRRGLHCLAPGCGHLWRGNGGRIGVLARGGERDRPLHRPPFPVD